MIRAILMLALLGACSKEPAPLAEGKCETTEFDGDNPSVEHCDWAGYRWTCMHVSNSWRCARDAALPAEVSR